MTAYGFRLTIPGLACTQFSACSPAELLAEVLDAAVRLSRLTRRPRIDFSLSYRREPSGHDLRIWCPVRADLPPVVGGDLTALADFCDENAAAWWAEAFAYGMPYALEREAAEEAPF